MSRQLSYEPSRMNFNRNPPRGRLPWRFIKFCLVGGSGLVVDMAMLCFLTDSKHLAISYLWAKVGAAETALINNFIWNEVWTFRKAASSRRGIADIVKRAIRFHAICGMGIIWSVGLLWLFCGRLGLNLYFGNFVAILLVTGWNYWLNARFNWTAESTIEM